MADDASDIWGNLLRGCEESLKKIAMNDNNYSPDKRLAELFIVSHSILTASCAMGAVLTKIYEEMINERTKSTNTNS